MSVDLARAWLERAKNADGTWGYLAGQPGRGEATLLAVASGQPAPLDWLATADLGFGKLLLPAALSAVPEAATLCRAVATQILLLRGLPSERNEVVAHDPTIPGWSWVPGTSSWVEPTAFALLSLHKAGLGDHERVRQGETLLIDRQCDDGGWNYGNIAVYGERLGGATAPSAWAAMALPPGPVVEKAMAFLETTAEEPSSESLSLGILARVAHGRPVGAMPERLLARQTPDGAFNDRVDTTALAALALQAATEGTHVFDLTS